MTCEVVVPGERSAFVARATLAALEIEKENDVRWIRKLLIISLAALGAYRLYELGRAKATSVGAQAGPPVGDALDTVKTTAAKVKDDIGSARDDVVDDLKTAVGADDPATATGAHLSDHPPVDLTHG
jgi:hypothetical protein